MNLSEAKSMAVEYLNVYQAIDMPSEVAEALLAEVSRLEELEKLQREVIAAAREHYTASEIVRRGVGTEHDPTEEDCFNHICAAHSLRDAFKKLDDARSELKKEESTGETVIKTIHYDLKNRTVKTTYPGRKEAT